MSTVEETITIVAATNGATLASPARLSAAAAAHLDALVDDFNQSWPGQHISRSAYIAAALPVWIDNEYERLTGRRRSVR